MDNTEQLTHISLCTGYGGIDLGLGRVLPSLRTIAYAEIEAFACANLVSKIEAGLLDAAPIWTDLETFPWSSFRDRVDILSGGFPCQPFSSAGRRAGDADPRHLWPHIARGIRICRPAIIFLENVIGIISSKLKGDEWRDRANTPVLLHVLRELERLGYKAEAGIFSAAEVGAPHQRQRVFILGCRSDLNERAREIIDVGNYTSGYGQGSQRRWGSIETRASISTRKSGDVDHTSSPSRKCSRAPIHEGRPDMDWRGQSIPSERDASHSYSTAASDAGLGDSEHYGRTPTEIRGSDGSSGHRGTPRQDSSRQSESTIPTVYPAPRGAKQHPWEPPRVTGTKPTMGRDSHGTACRMDYAELSDSVDNRTDELRLLGNGVVPATAERAFVTLFNRL